MSNNYRNNCKIIAISGFSGAGKDTIAKDIAKLFDLNIVVSYTTRPRRPNEEEGVEYFFISDNEFCTKLIKNKLLITRCYETVFGNWFYGVREEKFLNNRTNIIILDNTGYEQLIKHFDHKNVIGIFIDTPEELRKERAKQQRADFNEDEWNRRYQDDIKKFPTKYIKNKYDFILKNIEYSETINEISKIINTIKQN